MRGERAWWRVPLDELEPWTAAGWSFSVEIEDGVALVYRDISPREIEAVFELESLWDLGGEG